MSCKSLLIGLDGATFTVLDPFMAQGLMPNLKSLVDGGVRATLRTIVPALTPPAWTSLMTGRRPGHHGIFDFFQKSAANSEKIEFSTSKDVRTETVWSMVNKNGLSVTVLNFPLMFPAPELNGHVVAGWIPWRQLRLGCYPSNLYDRLKALPGFNVRELAMDMALEAKATEGAAEEEYAAWIELHTRREQQWLKVASYLMENEPSDLVAVLFDGPDKIGHLLWRFIDPAYWPANPTAEEVHIRDMCFNYFHKLDQAIGQLVGLAGSEATIILASDHGFGATTEVFHINTWLAERGYLTWVDNLSIDASGGTLGMGHLSRHIHWFDWSKTLAYASTPTSNGIHILKAENPGDPGVPASEYEAFRARLMAELVAFKDAQTGDPIVVEIHTQEEAFAGTAQKLAPDLTLVLRDGGLVSILPSDTPLKPRAKPEGTHRPLGIFIGQGPGLKQGLNAGELSILDITPILLYSLDMGIPNDLEGRVPGEIYEEAHQRLHPVQMAAPTTSASEFETEDSYNELYDADAEAAILARLMELGYID